jgi:hypothetical protein
MNVIEKLNHEIEVIEDMMRMVAVMSDDIEGGSLDGMRSCKKATLDGVHTELEIRIDIIRAEIAAYSLTPAQQASIDNACEDCEG